MRTLIIGSGAVGSIVAGILSQKGYNVDIACKNKDISDLINSDGLIFKIKNRKHLQFVNAYPNVSETPGNYDYVLLATKAFDIEEPTKEVIPKLSQQGLIVSMQDGYCADRLARLAGSDRIVGAVVAWGATLIENSISVMTSGGEMMIGKLDGTDDPRLDNLQYMLSFIAPTSVVSNINEQIFSKLIINSCVTTIGAISGLKVGAVITNRNMRNIFIQIIHEALLISEALKLKIPDYAGKINYSRLIRGHSLYHRVRKHLKIRLFGLKYRKVKSSGLQSLERNEKTEIDYLNGYIVSKGKEMGIDLPVNERLVQLIHEIEEKKRKISIENLNDKLFGLK